ncbi:hypothetical protein DFH08DRAFT_824955 [Mycena albidolilacea]|uniref:Uncharacterized protein n=1 Tax=Mycena albidolilacea TaxID=1033008 RepID=A0AAD6Z492_9AGAR|nr:hypothetical protein DFH08DRAFT_824955 [Mycena albidolilacea]
MSVSSEFYDTYCTVSAILGPEDEIPAVPYSRKVQDDRMRCRSGQNYVDYKGLEMPRQGLQLRNTARSRSPGSNVSMLTTSPRMVFGDSTPSGEEGGAPAPTSNAANAILAQHAVRQATSPAHIFRCLCHHYLMSLLPRLIKVSTILVVILVLVRIILLSFNIHDLFFHSHPRTATMVFINHGLMCIKHFYHCCLAARMLRVPRFR